MSINIASYIQNGTCQKTESSVNKNNEAKSDLLSQPVTIPVEAYLSEDYARAERDKLWRRVWLQAGRVDELAEIGDYLSYEILDDSIIILRGEDNELHAFHNACPHRGRRLVDVAQGARNAQGHRDGFQCGFHGWRFNLQGENTFIPHIEDWQGKLDQHCTSLSSVRVDTWVDLDQPGPKMPTAAGLPGCDP